MEMKGKIKEFKENADLCDLEMLELSIEAFERYFELIEHRERKLSEAKNEKNIKDASM